MREMFNRLLSLRLESVVFKVTTWYLYPFGPVEDGHYDSRFFQYLYLGPFEIRFSRPQTEIEAMEQNNRRFRQGGLSGL